MLYGIEDTEFLLHLNRKSGIFVGPVTRKLQLSRQEWTL